MPSTMVSEQSHSFDLACMHFNQLFYLFALLFARLPDVGRAGAYRHRAIDFSCNVPETAAQGDFEGSFPQNCEFKDDLIEADVILIDLHRIVRKKAKQENYFLKKNVLKELIFFKKKIFCYY